MKTVGINAAIAISLIFWVPPLQANPAAIAGLIGGLGAPMGTLMLGQYTVARFTLDSARLRADISRKIASNLGFKPEPGPRPNCYSRPRFLEKGPSFCYFESIFVSPRDTLIISRPPLPVDTSNITKGILVARYGFESRSQNGYSPAIFLGNFLMSAYFQELDPTYRNEAGQFTRLPSKSSGDFWWRNTISSGWAMQYVFKDNPMRPGGFSRGVMVTGGYFFDLLSWFPILAGPFIGDESSDRIAIPIVGLVSHLLFKMGLMGLAGSSELEFYLDMGSSPYRIPVRMVDEPY